MPPTHGRDSLKLAAALRAVDYLRDDMVVGLGSGSTAQFAILEIGDRVARGLRLLAVPTSEKTAALARQLGIPLTTLQDHPRINITIDGADEVELSTLNAIKGRGGALLREKIVALATDVETLIVDETKVVARLGKQAPVPVEIVPFGWNRTRDTLASLGCAPHLRTDPSGVPVTSDSGNYLLDCRFDSIDLPVVLGEQIKSITGVIEHGIFAGIARRIIVAYEDGVQVIDRGDIR